MDVILWLITYLLTINLIGFFAMGLDKRKARKHTFRIPESTLLMLAVIGGSVGTLLGMYLFRHKTRHWYFAYGLPAILGLQLILLLFLYYSPIEVLIM
ncbi:MAG: DUF1294 domain-containing protein [Lachnospiraceae bacterium]|nr:DUF1294 domain-containing protein [Lachnospiraceae bacterium]